MKIRFILLFIAFFVMSNSYAKSIYVANYGDDNNIGSIENPIKSIQLGVNLIQQGDTLFLREGCFNINKPIYIRKTGTSSKWFTIMAYKNEHVEINAEAYKKSKEIPKGYYGEDGIIDLDSCKYVQIINIGVCHTRGRGFKITNSDYINLIGCSSRATFNSGIGVRFTSNLKILHCEVVDANNQDYRPYGFKRRREAPQEAISLMPAWNFEVAYNHVHNNRKEGIDCKEISSFGTIHHNYVHNNDRQGIYLDSWFGRLHHIEVYENHIHDNDYGIAISSENDNSRMDSIKIHHNLIYNNRGSGVLFGEFGHDEKRTDISIFNNTIVNNGKAGHWSGLTGGIEFQSSNLSNIKVYNNIIAFNYGYSIGTDIFPSKVEKIYKSKRIEIEHNLCFPEEKHIQQERNYFDLVYPYIGNHSITEDPNFKQKEINNYISLNKNLNEIGKYGGNIGIGDKIFSLPHYYFYK